MNTEDMTLPRYIPYRENPRWSAIGLLLALIMVWPALHIGWGAGLIVSVAAIYCLLLVIRGWRCSHIILESEAITVPMGVLQMQKVRFPYTTITKVEKFLKTNQSSDDDALPSSQFALRIKTEDSCGEVLTSLLPDKETLDEIESFLKARCVTDNQ